MSFAGVYPHYITKAEKKGRTKEEVDAVICWLTGYDQKVCRNRSIRKQAWNSSLNKLTDPSQCLTHYRCYLRLPGGRY